ncbi:NAD(P)/FAD-dependent oxidoreductase [Herbiconiux sp. SYSU D00978]|uniref:NAD(P)/FAD-dependent oxidoreductase n=1 Tax=Herbiconiux sp. SYSU D00978 TaxID=2812562 RepID=UPI001A97B82C|nr:NAD(P)/FAD-dependent oxidoreductase [Herbiconiux sp. SYSU D00978]
MTADATAEVVVVGGGVAGLSAALVLGRSRRRVIVVDAGEPRNRYAHLAHGFLGHDGVPPSELLERGRAEVERYDVEVRPGRVLAIEGQINEFTLRLEDGELTANRVVVATGLHDRLPDIPGLEEQWGRRVLSCPYCHGWEHREQRIAVLGFNSWSVHTALLLTQWSDDVTFFPHCWRLSEDEERQLLARGVQIVPGDVEEVTDAGPLVIRVGGMPYELDVAFVTSTVEPLDELLKQVGCATADAPPNAVVVNAAGATSVAGIYAAGNVVDTVAQLVNSAAEGARVGTSVNQSLLDDDVASALVSAVVGPPAAT